MPLFGRRTTGAGPPVRTGPIAAPSNAVITQRLSFVGDPRGQAWQSQMDYQTTMGMRGMTGHVYLQGKWALSGQSARDLPRLQQMIGANGAPVGFLGGANVPGGRAIVTPATASQGPGNPNTAVSSILLSRLRSQGSA